MTHDIPNLIEDLYHDHIVLPRDLELRAGLTRLREQMFVKKLPDLPAGVGNRREQRALLVTGCTGTGKSYTVGKALDVLTPSLLDPCGRALKIISVKLPSPYSGKELARRILRLMDVEMSERLNEIELWEAVIEHFEAKQVALLHLDEFQRHSTIKAIGRAQKTEAADRLAATLNELLMHDRWPVSLLISGTEEILDFWRTTSVDQVYRRTGFVVFGQMDETYYAGLEQALTRYGQTAGIPVDINVPDLGGRICMAGENTPGIALELLQEAVVSAVRAGATELTINHLAEVFARRNHAPRDQNPFLAANWTKIGVREKLSLEELEDQERAARDRRASGRH